MDKSKIFWYTYIGVILLAIVCMFLIYQKDWVSDEGIHWEQIQMFQQGDYTVHYKLTTIPGYHAIVFSLMTIFGYVSFDSARIFTTIFLTLALIPAFFALTGSWRRVLQIYFFPLMFVFYFMLYTDLTSVVFISVAFLFLFNKKYNLAALFFIFSILVRQNNFMWLGFGLLYVLVDHYHEWFGSLKSIDIYKITGKSWLRALFSKIWLYIVGIILFGVFVIINQGIVIGDRGSHMEGFYSTNIYYILFISFFMFLPSILLRLKDIWAWMKEHKVLTVLLIILPIIFCLVNFHNTHWYNNLKEDGGLAGNGIMRNIILHWADIAVLNKILFMIPIIVTIFYLIVTRLRRPFYYWLYPFTVLYLGASELVDTRYYFIPLFLFMLFREEGSDREEYYLLGYFILLSIVMFIGILRHSMVW